MEVSMDFRSRASAATYVVVVVSVKVLSGVLWRYVDVVLVGLDIWIFICYSGGWVFFWIFNFLVFVIYVCTVVIADLSLSDVRVVRKYLRYVYSFFIVFLFMCCINVIVWLFNVGVDDDGIDDCLWLEKIGLFDVWRFDRVDRRGDVIVFIVFVLFVSVLFLLLIFKIFIICEFGMILCVVFGVIIIFGVVFSTFFASSSARVSFVFFFYVACVVVFMWLFFFILGWFGVLNIVIVCVFVCFNCFMIFFNSFVVVCFS